ncbi:MAG: tetratricopeptide repeat protein, partial [Betaproteobacteria bacterium]
MKRALVLIVLLAGCATAPSPVEQAREHYSAGRGDEALTVLEQAMRQRPDDQGLRREYFRLRDTLAGQWLAQAEVLRQAGRHDEAQALYARVQAHDPGNPRAQSGLAQIDTDRRHRVLVAEAEQLVKAGKVREAQDILRPVLTEYPQHREARRLQRTIDERLVKPAIATVQLRPSIA